MTSVDFYVLQQNSIDDRKQFACRLIDKVVRQGHKVILNEEQATDSADMDQRLWAFKPESFIPHVVAGDANTQNAAVVLVNTQNTGEDTELHEDVLINLAMKPPSNFARFQRLVEIVVQEPEILAATRKNYAIYKSQGYTINMHKL
ncbi:MAG: DNA polymerase III subunit chi [Alteromonadaceae bacterium]|nr:MAG: DNA polymerase III subunit chi [Alteromonadaceae bacterium]